jgi:AraC family transcriptional regulator
MDQQTSRTDYSARLERVMTWLVAHLDDALDLNRLADVACMSPYHFHRIYHAMRGETAAETVRRMRLHRAAVELANGEKSLTRIAQRAGYGSQEAFSRAFKAAFGTPPARYRASAVPTAMHCGTEELMDLLDIAMNYTAAIQELPPVSVASLEHRGDYRAISGVFGRLVATAGGLGLLRPETRSFGIYHDDPSATAVKVLRSQACISVPEDWAASGELQRDEIRGGRYAVTTHIGPYVELQRLYAWLYGSWLAQSGEETADAPCIELYVDDARTVPPAELRTQIWLPLR